jgi:hypothetical protein
MAIVAVIPTGRKEKIVGVGRHYILRKWDLTLKREAAASYTSLK